MLRFVLQVPDGRELTGKDHPDTKNTDCSFYQLCYVWCRDHIYVELLSFHIIEQKVAWIFLQIRGWLNKHNNRLKILKKAKAINVVD